ncbi:hypothetical protein ANO14919_136440 [Xylariales sp. No.14919]|nr:hypothetical protein ANO14919_136440 [Xylariales sp. No.14919]
MIVVGAADQNGGKAPFSQNASFLTTYASGYDIYDANTGDDFDTTRGTSFAAPQVAALAAYFKQLPSRWQSQMNQPNTNGPKAVKAMIVALQRYIKKAASGKRFDPAVPLVWNGMDVGLNCLVEQTQEQDEKAVCPKLPDDITTYEAPASCAGVALAAEPPMVAVDNTTLFERRSDGFCTLAPDAGGGIQITFTSGASAGPTCGNASGCGGTVCSGYWCAPTPTGYPPNHQDPQDPNSSGYVAPTTTTGPINTTFTSTITLTVIPIPATTTATWAPPASESPSSSSTTLPLETPHVDCGIWVGGELKMDHVIIQTDDWVTDDGENLKSKVINDCGGVLNWTAKHVIGMHEFGWDVTHSFIFDLPSFFLEGGCLESAIENAGGPNKVVCKRYAQ